MAIRKPTGYWTYERCKDIALTCNKRFELEKKNSSVYNKILREKWVELFSHMVNKHRNLTKELCTEIAKPFNTRIKFERFDKSAYEKARKSGWLDEVCSHMELDAKSLKNRYVYTIMIDDYAYVGLTYDTDRRFKEHLRQESSGVFKFIQENNINHDDIQYTINGYYDEELASIMETHFENECIEKGFTLINTAKTGGLGKSTRKWTKEKCQEEALKYKYRNEFKTFSSGAYHASKRYDWMDDICSHMEYKNKPTGYWTIEKCKEEASKYNTRSSFQKGCKEAYRKALNKGWLDGICSHMIQLMNPKGYWSYERCKEVASKYNTRKEFCDNCRGASDKSYKESWMDDFFPKVK
jgi:hypothetical protein